MGWILQCLLYVTVAISSAYSYREGPINFSAYGFDRIQNRRIDYDPASQDYVNWSSNQQPTTRNPQRMNERSISVTSGIQRVQDKERRRLQSATASRSENVTYKIVNSQLRYPSVTNRRGAVEERLPDSVVFPGQTSAKTFVPEIPKECQDIGICESVPNYPQDLVDNIIAKLGDRLGKLRIDELDEPEIAQRIGPDELEIPLCDSREEIMKPQAARKKNSGSWYYVLNSKEKPLQGLRVEICRNNGATCKYVNFYDGYTYSCKQKYVQRMVLAANSKLEVEDIPVRVPSCCSCVAYKTNDRR